MIDSRLDPISYLFLIYLPFYELQSDWIRQNCASQMERVRETYYSQSENIKGYRQYGSTQIQGVRDQYYDQVKIKIVLKLLTEMRITKIINCYWLILNVLLYFRCNASGIIQVYNWNE